MPAEFAQSAAFQHSNPTDEGAAASRISLTVPQNYASGRRRSSIGMRHSLNPDGGAQPALQSLASRRMSRRGSNTSGARRGSGVGRLALDAAAGANAGNAQQADAAGPQDRWAAIRQRSQSTSRRNSSSIASVRSTSSSTSSKGEAQPEEPQREEKVLQLKGLPPQEAMLARKNFRATSVDHGQVAGSEDMMSASASLEVKDKGRHDSSSSVMQEVEKEGKPQRAVKQGQDTELVLFNAMAKLEALDVEPESPMQSPMQSPKGSKED